MAGILGLVAIVGIVWLVGVATGGGEGEPVGRATDAPAAPDATTGPTASATGRTDGTGAQPSASGGGPSPKAPQSGRRSIHWNGVHLNGSPGGDGCLTVINKTSTVGVVESVSFTVASGPGSATARADVAHCSPTGDPPCEEIRLRAGSQCLAGAILTGEASPDPYLVQATVHFRYVCVNVEDAPCDEVEDWQGPPPTVEAPVEISGTTTDIPRVEAYIDAPSPAPPPSSPEGPSPDPSPATVPESPGASPEGG
ncbi:hypothetical protein [Streptosporangium roseum]|uniref:Uncharacterized protein n=1 Tax=Streptosporangium roseum (strain ATCC 12428 / DSM 43021 / JCM 3005 / KCTC 9067 / NCIMB 10171 / NRRL 2505 / NI 9100) TaxID=479432 RepID=D2AYD3_STRRD|nr:hypothetical protein [Streptosporangium roseum]ACZ87143.1 hypothetical protein Sros_4241 [Streptosporangium roseum DSM 43021]